MFFDLVFRKKYNNIYDLCFDCIFVKKLSFTLFYLFFHFKS